MHSGTGHCLRYIRTPSGPLAQPRARVQKGSSRRSMTGCLRIKNTSIQAISASERGRWDLGTRGAIVRAIQPASSSPRIWQSETN